MRARIERQRVARDDLEAIGIARGDLAKRRNRALVALDGDDARALRQKRAGQPAGAGADLEHVYAFERAGRAGDPGGEVEIEQEVLAKRLLRAQLMPPDHLPQWREIIERAHARRNVAAVAPALSRCARRRAAIRLDGSARAVPAMSKAVPWSGEVRTNGKPRVTLTA